ncbi:major facilitator superfamily domain-containing protein [Hypoxylon trugodes]|uniref:major facilitator superfamily domain-containing protein n=1 Tax=Hypoxylon trugodes TaxID=326681 RepID=UPI00219039BE|nr:major facilitator superfamily domain-containing protein [Hypoxylon trugodes]KAI1391906.1 major facilitator superfamily domain-containing protein [Hypoxylon trugodes]
MPYIHNEMIDPRLREHIEALKRSSLSRGTLLDLLLEAPHEHESPQIRSDAWYLTSSSSETLDVIPLDAPEIFNKGSDEPEKGLIAPPDVVPDGGMRAWLVVAGGFINYCATFGLLNSFGTFQTFYQEGYLAGSSASAISWIGSVQLFLLFIGGMVIGPAFDKYGARKLTIPGSILYVLSFMFISLGTKFYQILLAQGILYGIADAMLFYPTISSINQWFSTKRGLALGIVVSGSSIGGICWPILIERLFKIVGFGWTCRICGFICLGLLSVSTALIVERKSTGGGHGPINNASLKKELSNATYLIMTVGFLFAFLGMFIPFYYLPGYGMAHGIDPTMSNYLLAILNGGSFLGRIGSGFMSDRIGVFNITTIVATLSSVMVLALMAMTTQNTIIVFSALYGFFSGGLISLQSGAVAKLTSDMSTVGIKIGVTMAVCSVGVLIGGPIGGALLATDNGNYQYLIIFAGVTLSIGSALFLVSRIWAAPKSKVF